MSLPRKLEYFMIGAGVHGLSTAYHLAKYLRKTGKGSGEDVLVVDKSGIAAGASGVACGYNRRHCEHGAVPGIFKREIQGKWFFGISCLSGVADGAKLWAVLLVCFPFL